MGKDLKGKELGIGISQRVDLRYTARYTDKNGKRLQFYDFKLTKVKQWLNKVKYEDEHGLMGDLSNMTLTRWYEEWIENFKVGVVSHSTVKNYRNSYNNHIKPSVGNLQLKSIKSIHLQKVLNDMYENEYSYGTMNLVKITMSAIFKSAVENNLLMKNPVLGVKCKQREVEERRVLTVFEQMEFIKYASKSMYYNAYALCLQTGLRCGEIGGLKWSDINWDKRVLHVRRTLLFKTNEEGGYYFGNPKSKSSKREIPLTDEAIDILKNQRIEQFKLRAKSIDWETNEEYFDLIFTTINGKPTGHSTYRNNIVRIVTNINKDRRAYADIHSVEYVEFEPMYMHALRHTFATRSIENEMKPKVLQVILGHSSISITMDLYVHVTDDIKHEEIKKVNNNMQVV
jgi:integrase